MKQGIKYSLIFIIFFVIGFMAYKYYQLPKPKEIVIKGNTIRGDCGFVINADTITINEASCYTITGMFGITKDSVFMSITTINKCIESDTTIILDSLFIGDIIHFKVVGNPDAPNMIMMIPDSDSTFARYEIYY